TGAADVKIINTGNVTTTLSHGFTIIAGRGGHLSSTLSAPSSVRAGRGFTVTVEFTNDGDADLLAPVLHLQGDNGNLSFFSDFRNTATALDVIAVSPTGPAGILAPGAHGRVTFYASSPSAVTITYRVAQGEFPNIAIPWTAIGTLIRPSEITSDSDWVRLFSQIQTEFGTTWDAFLRTISQGATLLPPARGLNYSLN